MSPAERSLLAVGLMACLLAGCGTVLTSSSSAKSPTNLTLTAPVHRLVYQRGLDGTTRLPVAGTCRWPGAALEARICPVAAPKSTNLWLPVGTAGSNGTFSTSLYAKAGWYRLEVRARRKGNQAVTAVERVGVGEVFIVVGHSVAHGGRTNLAGATDDRVNTIAWPSSPESARENYEQTADIHFLPPLVGTHFGSNVVPGPFGHGTYFWARFAQHVARSQDVPVLLLNAAFGGTSLEHWAKSARGELFEHSFVRAGIRMPYINLHHALRQYATATGVRAILADQGQNDWPEPDTRKVFTNYLAWVQQARADLAFPDLAIVVNRATPPGNKSAIRRAQESMIHDVPYCFPGPDYDTLAKVDRYDDVHLSEPGMEKAAKLWADSLTPTFFQKATPYQPRR